MQLTTLFSIWKARKSLYERLRLSRVVCAGCLGILLPARHFRPGSFLMSIAHFGDGKRKQKEPNPQNSCRHKTSSYCRSVLGFTGSVRFGFLMRALSVTLVSNRYIPPPLSLFIDKPSPYSRAVYYTFYMCVCLRRREWSLWGTA